PVGAADSTTRCNCSERRRAVRCLLPTRRGRGCLPADHGSTSALLEIARTRGDEMSAIRKYLCRDNCLHRADPGKCRRLHGYTDRSHADRQRCVRTMSPLRSEAWRRSEEHTSELQSRFDIVCRLLLEKKKITTYHIAQCLCCCMCCSLNGLTSHTHMRKN